MQTVGLSGGFEQLFVGLAVQVAGSQDRNMLKGNVGVTPGLQETLNTSSSV